MLDTQRQEGWMDIWGVGTWKILKLWIYQKEKISPELFYKANTFVWFVLMDSAKY